MQEITDWLQAVERLACDLYSEASVFFAQDKELSNLLNRLAQDEAWHFHLMGSATACLQTGEIRATSDITLDQATKDHIEAPLRHSHDALLESTLTKEQMIDFIVEAEFSEWNDIFVYTLNTLQECSKLFQNVAAIIQAHERRVRRFVNALPEDRKPLRDVGELPAVWKNRFLVVEDHEPLRDLLSRLLSKHGAVETAQDGREGLEQTAKHFYDVVITDVDMPAMNGLEFYRQAVEQDPSIRDRFVFCSGLVTGDREAFFQQHNLPYLLKPFSFPELVRLIETMVRDATENWHYETALASHS